MEASVQVVSFKASIRGFPKLGVLFGGPQNKDNSIWGLDWGPQFGKLS